MKRVWTVPCVAVIVAFAASSAAAQDGKGFWERLLHEGPSALWGGDAALELRNEAIALAHRARDEADAGDTEKAIATLKQARVAWPDSPQLAHMIADLYDASGRPEEALRWYGIAAPLGEAFRAHYHAGQISHALAEAALDEAGVPVDVAALPDQPDPELMAAIRTGIDALGVAREHFLDALLERSDARASESVSAITERIDELQEMLDELEQQQEEQEGEGEGDSPDDAPDDSGDEGEDGEGDQDQQGQPDEQPGEDEDDSDDRPEEEGDDPPPDDQESNENEGPPPSGEPMTEQFLTSEQMQRLEDKLEEMAELAARLDALARQREREAGERDW